jgi:hypothetical protein
MVPSELSPSGRGAGSIASGNALPGWSSHSGPAGMNPSGNPEPCRAPRLHLLFNPHGKNLHFVLSAAAVTLRKQDASKRQPAFHARRLVAQEPSHRGRVALLLPKRSLGTPTQ